MSRKLDIISIPLKAGQNPVGFPKRPIKAVRAAVTERMAAVFSVPAKVAQEIAGKRALTFSSNGSGKVPVVACIYRMSHAAPEWAPLEFGPACTAIALHLPLVEKDDKPALWIDRRYCDQNTATALSELGFPPVYAGLKHEQWLDFEYNTHERYSTSDNRLNLHLAERINRPAADDLSFDINQHFNDVEQSYVDSATGQTLSLQLSHREAGAFQYLPHTHGVIRTLWGVWPIAAVYRSSGGTFIWQTA